MAEMSVPENSRETYRVVILASELQSNTREGEGYRGVEVTKRCAVDS